MYAASSFFIKEKMKKSLRIKKDKVIYVNNFCFFGHEEKWVYYYSDKVKNNDITEFV